MAPRDRACCSPSSRLFDAFPLVVLVDDSEFAPRTLDNFLWVTFTRSNPAADVTASASVVVDKHWGCQGPLVIDARIKPHHAPPLEEDPEVTARVDRLFRRGRPPGRAGELGPDAKVRTEPDQINRR